MIAVVTPLIVGVATRRFLDPLPVLDDAEVAPHFGVLDAWREPRTLIVGLMVLGFAFTEGSANDWIAVALVDGYAPRRRSAPSRSAASWPR